MVTSFHSHRSRCTQPAAKYCNQVEHKLSGSVHDQNPSGPSLLQSACRRKQQNLDSTVDVTSNDAVTHRSPQQPVERQQLSDTYLIDAPTLMLEGNSGA